MVVLRATYSKTALGDKTYECAGHRCKCNKQFLCRPFLLLRALSEQPHKTNINQSSVTCSSYLLLTWISLKPPEYTLHGPNVPQCYFFCMSQMALHSISLVKTTQTLLFTGNTYMANGIQISQRSAILLTFSSGKEGAPHWIVLRTVNQS